MTLSRYWLGCMALLATTALLTNTAIARTLSPDDVPEPLEPWVDWVLLDSPEADCVQDDGGALCLWPGRLRLDLTSAGGSFELKVLADRDAAVSLPGDDTQWPQEVWIDGEQAVVLAVDGRPAVQVEAGHHVLRGRLLWTMLPEILPVPPGLALLDLSIDGESMPFPRREADGALWLASRKVEQEAWERLDVDVSRKVSDGVPLMITTRVLLRASGRAREVRLGQMLVPGTIPLSLDADLPARVDADGALHVQVRPGTWTLEISARSLGIPEQLSAPPRKPAPATGERATIAWPDHEIWVWQADDALRQVAIDGPPAVDPARTTLSEDWRHLPAWRVAPGQAVLFQSKRRGEPNPPPDRVSLRRTLWLDLGGGGYTVQDHLSGELSRSWRLNAQAPAVLGRVSVNGVNQLITADPQDGAAGVELRSSALHVVAESRIDDAIHALPAVGWSADIDSLETALRLPPGWLLLGASGVDQLDRSWVGSWTLLGFFVVLLVALSFGRLTSWRWAPLALLALVLGHDEPGAPFLVWIALLLPAALLRVLPTGKMRQTLRLAWIGGIISLALVLLPYAVNQIRGGLYPQLRSHASAGDGWLDEASELTFGALSEADAIKPLGQYDAPSGSAGAVAEEATLMHAIQDKALLANVDGAARGLGNMPAARRKSQLNQALKGSFGTAKRQQALQQDPQEVVQTGPGVPRWNWQSWTLRWDGPVVRDHEMTLWLLGPKVNLALSFLRVLLALALTGALLRRWPGAEGPTTPTKPPREQGAATAKAATAASLAFVLAGLAGGVLLTPAHALASDFPNEALLHELRARLLQPPDCQGECLQCASLSLQIEERQLKVQAEVHAGADVAWALPGPVRQWAPAEVRIDGQESHALVLGEDGFIRLRLSPGRHQVELLGPLPPSESLTLQFAELPRRVQVEAPGWKIDGVREDGRVESSIQLSRALDARRDPGTDGTDPSTEAADYEQAALPPWLLVRRSFDFGVPWLMHTTVERVSPLGAPVLLRVPLLEGESVTESNLSVEAGAVVVSLGRDDSGAAWSSILSERESLQLTAPAAGAWSEVWVIRASPVWQCEAEGVAPTRHTQGGRLSPVYHPWPGESLKLQLKRPSSVAGQIATIDAAVLKLQPGTRQQKAQLELSMRLSQGGLHRIGFPAQATVQSVEVDGHSEAIRRGDTGLDLSLEPGAHQVLIKWQSEGGMRAMQQSPQVVLGAPAANLRLEIDVPGERWLLYAGGPSWGPAVLFWGMLLAAVLGGLLLGRLRMSPLKGWQWALLAVGLMLTGPEAALVLVGWFFVLELRARRPNGRAWAFDLLQVLLVAWTMVAMGTFYDIVHRGLLMQPEMQVDGAGSWGRHLVWIADRVAGDSPAPGAWVLSVPLWIYKGLMLCWSLWLAASLLRWLPWAWTSFSKGQVWLPLRKAKDELPSNTDA